MTDNRADLTKQMKALSPETRRSLIDAADNVIGYDRFLAREVQVGLSHAMRSPQKPDGVA